MSFTLSAIYESMYTLKYSTVDVTYEILLLIITNNCLLKTNVYLVVTRPITTRIIVPYDSNWLVFLLFLFKVLFKTTLRTYDVIQVIRYGQKFP